MKKLICSFALVMTLCSVFSQADFIELGNRQYNALDRFEIMLRKDSVLNYSAMKPYDRKSITQRLEYISELSKAGKINLSKVDKYNLDIMLKDNFNWRSNFGDTTMFSAKNCFGAAHLTNPYHFGLKRGDFSVFSKLNYSLHFGKDNSLDKKIYNRSQMLFLFKGTFTKNLGYYVYTTDNEMRNPLYVQQFTNKFGAVPGLGYYKNSKTNVHELFEVKGGIMYNATKNIDLQFAYDKLFVGNGYRSLILSDYSNNFLFFKINTRIWKFNYTNIFAELQNKINDAGNIIYTDTLLPKKYMAMHVLDVQVTKWLNIALFEHIIFGKRATGFDFAYLNPAIFYVAVNHQLGSPDKATVGFNIKANAFKNTQLYGQVIINEFVTDEVVHYNRGWWGNKQAVQLGFKNINFLGVPNLDVQGEVNLVRPFVYSHQTNYGSYTHYNQALAHPLGANFKEFIGIVKYQPVPKLTLQGKLIYYKQGTDSSGYNMGNNLLLPYQTRPRDYGWKIGTGIPATCLFAQATATYEILPNIFF